MTSSPCIWLVATASTFYAGCDCGWRSDSTDQPDRAQAAADGHQAETGHRRGALDGPGVLPGVADRRLHPPCGWVHGWNDWCPTPSESPRGRVLRVLAGEPTDRLAAVHELREWLDDQERQAVIQARLSRLSWVEIGAAFGGLSRQAAHNRWGKLARGLEVAAEGADGPERR